MDEATEVDENMWSGESRGPKNESGNTTFLGLFWCSLHHLKELFLTLWFLVKLNKDTHFYPSGLFANRSNFRSDAPSLVKLSLKKVRETTSEFGLGEG